jgi:hypothetical protein
MQNNCKPYDLNLTLLSEAKLHFDAMLMFQGRSHKDEKGEQTDCTFSILPFT